MRNRTKSQFLVALLIGAACAFAQTPGQSQEQSGAAPGSLEKRGLSVEGATKRGPKAGPVTVPRGYALIVGVGEYLNPKVTKLQFAETDANSLYSALISQEGGNFAPADVKKLTGKDATLANIRQALEQWLPSVAKADDRVLIYFAGHGFMRNGRGFLAPHDVNLDDLDRSAYPMDDLGKVVGKSIKARWKVLLTDACHSGAIRADVETEAINERLGNLDTSLFSLTAASKRQSSYEDSSLGKGAGLFTYFVVKALEGEADEDTDGVVSADELREYVSVHVRDYARKRSYEQTPVANQDFDSGMVLAYNPARSGNVTQMKTGDLVVVSNMDGVEVFLDGKSAGKVNKDKPLPLPGLSPGTHTIQGVRSGYDSYGPMDVIIYPGRPTTVNVRIQFARPIKKAALDLFQEGKKLYLKGSDKDSKAALSFFQRALAEDPRYSDAALYLGRTHQVLFETAEALKYHQLAIELDKDNLEARVSYGATLLDTGDTDEAIRQLTYAIDHDSKNSQAFSHLAEAYRLGGSYDRGVEMARKAISLDASNSQAHLWLGDSLRMLSKYDESADAYKQFIQLTNFESSTSQKVAYHAFRFVIPTPLSKRRASQQAVFRDQRNMAYLGICICEKEAKHYIRALDFCNRALQYDAKDVYTLFHLAGVYRDRFNASALAQQPEWSFLTSAQSNYQKMLSINAELEESNLAKEYLKRINEVLKLRPGS